MNVATDFLNELQHLRGLECWGVAAGEGTGSNVTLHFGKKIERARPLKNPTLPDTLRRFDGEFIIFIKNCAWRLDTDKVVCSSKTPNNNDGAMVSGLRSLTGQNVVAATATLPAHDLLVEFSGASRLRLFCDCFDQEHDGDNYSFHSTDKVLVAGAGGVLVSEPRRKA